jgi:archaellum component FlaC
MKRTAEERKKIDQTKKYLSQAYMLSERIETLKTDLAKAAQPLSGISYESEPVSSSNISDLADRMNKEDNVQLKLQAKITELETTLNRIRDQINGLEDNVQATLLYKRYVLMEDWVTINIEMKKVAWRNMFRVHDSGLIHFFEKYLEKVSSNVTKCH